MAQPGPYILPHRYLRSFPSTRQGFCTYTTVTIHLHLPLNTHLFSSATFRGGILNTRRLSPSHTRDDYVFTSLPFTCFRTISSTISQHEINTLEYDFVVPYQPVFFPSHSFPLYNYNTNARTHARTHARSLKPPVPKVHGTIEKVSVCNAKGP